MCMTLPWSWDIFPKVFSNMCLFIVWHICISIKYLCEYVDDFLKINFTLIIKSIYIVYIMKKIIMSDRIYIAYLHFCWFSQKNLHKISENTPSMKYFFEKLSYKSLSKIISWDTKKKKILEAKKTLNTERIWKIISDLQVTIIIYSDENYPDSLKNIPNSPYILYVRWTIPSGANFWVVGSRKTSYYWERVIKHLIPNVSNVFNIISWWATWCDTLAHKKCLENNWKTIVVVWTGINLVYPVSNKRLFEKVIVSWWAVISIFPIDEPWNPYNFPIRNEIVVWLSVWILVVEAQERSGSLITAWLALDLWKDLFSVPWDITLSSSRWTNKLIQKWEAKCVLESSDILEEYDAQVQKTTIQDTLSLLNEDEKMICELISWDEKSIDYISESTW